MNYYRKNFNGFYWIFLINNCLRNGYFDQKIVSQSLHDFHSTITHGKWSTSEYFRYSHHSREIYRVMEHNFHETQHKTSLRHGKLLQNGSLFLKDFWKPCNITQFESMGITCNTTLNNILAKQSIAWNPWLLPIISIISNSYGTVVYEFKQNRFDHSIRFFLKYVPYTA